ncbi:hypothetical protein FB451DRAFT_1025508, partial [Mycena latifolia]
FLRMVLPQHAASLVELACPARNEGAWSFGPHFVDALSQLHNLTHLEMSVNLGDIGRPKKAVVRACLSHLFSVPY